MKIYFFLSLMLIMLTGFSANGTHIIGGEISYVCLGDDDYEFTMKIYRDCYYGLAPFDNPAYYSVFDGNGNLFSNGSVNLLSHDTINEASNDPCFFEPVYVCTEIGTYQFTINLPASATGYTLVYQRCCRASIVVNINDASNIGSTYLTTIPASSLASCNNSPYSNDTILPYICISTPFSIDGSVTDPDGDSIVYELCAPYTGASPFNPLPMIASSPPYTPVDYAPPYSATNPIAANPAIALNSQTGELTGTPIAFGTYVIGTCAKEFRNGVEIGDYRRDFVITVVSCGIAQIESPNIYSCSDVDTVHFYNNSNNSYTFHWDFGDPGVTDDTSNLFEPTYIYTGYGTYVASLIATSADCIDTAYANIHLVNVQPDFTYSNLFIMEAGNFYDLSASSDGIITSWHWDFGDGNTSTLQNPFNTYNYGGIYTVQLKVTDGNGCEDSVSKQVAVIGTSAQDINNRGDFMVYPNPASGSINIMLPSKALSQLLTIELFDELGSKILSKETFGEEIIHLPVSGLVKGGYLVKVTSGDFSLKNQLVFIE